MIGKYLKWPYDVFFFEILAKKYFLESILKNSILPRVRDQIGSEKNSTLIFFSSPLYSNLHRLLSENSSDILNKFKFNELKKKIENIKKKLLRFGIYLKKILYEFNFNCICLNKKKIYFFTKIYKFQKNSHESIQKNFKFFNSDLYFWELITLSKAILVECFAMFFRKNANLFINILEWVSILKKTSTFTHHKYKWSTYVLSFTIFQKNLNCSFFSKIGKKNIENKNLFFFSDLFDGSLFEKIFFLCKIVITCAFLNSTTKFSILKKSLILIKYQINFSGTIHHNNLSTISNSFILGNVDKNKCTGNLLKSYLIITSFSIVYNLYEKLYCFRKKEIDFFYKYDNYYCKRKNSPNILNLKMFKQKMNIKIFIKNYDHCLIFGDSLLIFFYLNFSIVISYRKKTNLFIWFNLIKDILFYNYYLPIYLIATFIFISFPKFQKKTKHFNLQIYFGLYLELIFNLFYRKTDENILLNFNSNKSFLDLEISIFKIKKIIADYYFLFGYYKEAEFVIKKIKQQILYLKKNHSLFTKIDYELLIRRLLDFTETKNIGKIFEILGKINQNGKYFLKSPKTLHLRKEKNNEIKLLKSSLFISGKVFH